MHELTAFPRHLPVSPTSAVSCPNGLSYDGALHLASLLSLCNHLGKPNGEILLGMVTMNWLVQKLRRRLKRGGAHTSIDAKRGMQALAELPTLPDSRLTELL